LVNSSITIGGTAIALGASSNALANDITVNSVKVGRGASAVATNTAVGASALNANTTGSRSVAVGDNALLVNTTGERHVAIGSEALTANTTGSYNTGVGWRAMQSNTTGSFNLAVGELALTQNTTGSNNTSLGSESLFSNTTASNNTAVGYQALYSNTTATENTAVGYQALYSQTTASTGQNIALGLQAGYTTNGYYNTFIGYKSGLPSTGNQNTFIGHGSGSAMTSGSSNTILGIYSGNQDGLDIRTASNYVVLSDGDGARQITMKEGQTLALDSAVPNAGTGITFPATQSASSDANTLDDYEEGTWTPAVGDQTVVGTFSSNGNYTKIGRQVFFRGQVIGSTSITGAAGSYISGLPFTSALSGTGIGTNAFITASAGIFIGPSDNKVYIIGGYAATGNFEFSGMYFV
jgi:hypothetical protein